MRLIKSAREIEILRRNGKVSAEAVKQAMLAAGPGVYEYELEAVAMNVILKNGARGTAYPVVVGSGGNSCIYHYNKNRRRMKSGDVVVMDFGADLEYQCMDITRSWPAAGVFTAEQRAKYRIVLEYQKACIAAFRPGITAADARLHAEKIMKEKKIDISGMQGLYPHFVGMSVHDVGARGMIFREGMVIAFEPGLYFPGKNLGVRIEDTILITKEGCEVLSQDAPKEIAEIEALLAGKKRETIQYH
jgi:Xaa-Pro aminopeptidase